MWNWRCDCWIFWILFSILKVQQISQNKIHHYVNIWRACFSNIPILQLQCPTVLLHRVNTNIGDKIKTNKKAEVFSTFNTVVNSQSPSVCHCVTDVFLSRSVKWLIVVLDQSKPLLSLPDQSDCRSLMVPPQHQSSSCRKEKSTLATPFFFVLLMGCRVLYSPSN